MLINFLTSPSSIFETGMPVHLETMRRYVFFVDFLFQHAAGCGAGRGL